jgi:hypothetical protein
MSLKSPPVLTQDTRQNKNGPAKIRFVTQLWKEFKFEGNKFFNLINFKKEKASKLFREQKEKKEFQYQN